MAKVNNKTLKSGSRSLSYSMYDFIGAVKQHGGIWNRKHEEFHVRELRDRAWFNIARQLYSDFDAASVAEKQKIAETFAKRWKNTRDSFFRTLRRQEFGEKSHPYIYEKEMSFILNHKGNVSKNSSRYVINKQIKPKKQMVKGKRKPVDDGGNDDFEEDGNDSDTAASLTKSIKSEKNQLKERLRPSPKKTVTKKKILSAKKMRYNSDSDHEMDPLLDEEDAAVTAGHQKKQSQHDSNDNDGFIEIYSEVTNELNEENENASIKQSPAQEAQQQNYETAFVTFANDYQQNPQITSTPAAAAMTTKPTTEATSKLVATTTAATSSAAAAAASPQYTQSSSFFNSHASDMDADQAFLYSITPAIRSMSVEKKLDFQIDVLKLLKNYTSKS